MGVMCRCGWGVGIVLSNGATCREGHLWEERPLGFESRNKRCVYYIQTIYSVYYTTHPPF
jgi:hypothetical protein